MSLGESTISPLVTVVQRRRLSSSVSNLSSSHLLIKMHGLQYTKTTTLPPILYGCDASNFGGKQAEGACERSTGDNILTLERRRESKLEKIVKAQGRAP
jgi:hypothetical protein